MVTLTAAESYPVKIPNLLNNKFVIANRAVSIDNDRDLEFVDVEFGRDDPHSTSYRDWDDNPHYFKDGDIFTGKMELTAFNHFIDIKKGPGIFDDYDGYSYNKGSAQGDGHETEAGKAVDGWIAYWFNDEYVHAPGQPWYKKGSCSLSLERYSFPQDKGAYPSVEAECVNRFPLADCVGKSGKGFPYSIFMPVDNMARYWYDLFERTKNVSHLGPVMHAIQDASIPQHVAGYCGNWHRSYENDIDKNIDLWLKQPQFISGAIALFNKWNRTDPTPPGRLLENDWNKVPAKNWRVDQLVTWMALNAYKEYKNTYQNFRNGYNFNAASAENLTKMALAMTMLLIARAEHVLGGNVAAPEGTIIITRGTIKMLRVHQTGTGYGPPGSQMKEDCIFTIDTEPGAAFGVDLIGKDVMTGRTMFNTLRNAFNRNIPVKFEYVAQNSLGGRVIRVYR